MHFFDLMSLKKLIEVTFQHRTANALHGLITSFRNFPHTFNCIRLDTIEPESDLLFHVESMIQHKLHRYNCKHAIYPNEHLTVVDYS